MMSEEIQNDMGSTIAKGATGIFGVAGGITVNNLPTVNTWLQTVSLLVGIAVGIATFVSIVRKKK